MNATEEISRLEAAPARVRGERGHGAVESCIVSNFGNCWLSC